MPLRETPSPNTLITPVQDPEQIQGIHGLNPEKENNKSTRAQTVHGDGTGLRGRTGYGQQGVKAFDPENKPRRKGRSLSPPGYNSVEETQRITNSNSNEGSQGGGGSQFNQNNPGGGKKMRSKSKKTHHKSNRNKKRNKKKNTKKRRQNRKTKKKSRKH